jgi:hypothetical protein
MCIALGSLLSWVNLGNASRSLFSEVPMNAVRLVAIIPWLALGFCRFLPAETAVAVPAREQTPAPALFDPARHMRVSEVHPGMTGYGLSVFSGSKIERFDIEVISILRNFNPQDDVVLIRCKGEFLEHAGSIAGMSGSPIYLRDTQGRDRMIGAFAYGWPLSKDPVAGVQPIEYMLALPTKRSMPTTSVTNDGSAGRANGDAIPGASRATWSMKQPALMMQTRYRAVHSLLSGLGRPDAGGAGTESLTGNGQSLPHLQPLATPLMTSGISPELMKTLGPAFGSMGLTMLQAGGGSGSGPGAAGIPLEPGSVLAVPLLTGDADLTAIGTVTEVLGDRMWGFGHPFNNEGGIDLPMGGGEIQSVIANLQTSFKLGSMSKASGTLTTDMSVGVAGRVGSVPATVPIDFHVTYADGSPAHSYHFEASQNPKMLPMIAGVAFSSALTGPNDLPQYNTVDYDLVEEFANGQTLRIQNRAANAAINDLFGEIGTPLTTTTDNPFQRVLIKKISGNVRISNVPKAAQLMDITVPKQTYRPGEKLKGYASYKPFWGKEDILPIEMDLPRDLPKGTYHLIVSDAQRYVQDEQQSQPFQFTAQSIDDVFAIFKDLVEIHDNAVYLRLVRQPDGVAIGRTALQRLPSSRRQILMGAGRSATTEFISSTVKVIPTDNVMSGSAEFVITIDPSKTVTAGPGHAGNNAEPPKAALRERVEQ